MNAQPLTGSFLNYQFVLGDSNFQNNTVIASQTGTYNGGYTTSTQNIFEFTLGQLSSRLLVYSGAWIPKYTLGGFYTRTSGATMSGPNSGNFENGYSTAIWTSPAINDSIQISFTGLPAGTYKTMLIFQCSTDRAILIFFIIRMVEVMLLVIPVLIRISETNIQSHQEIMASVLYLFLYILFILVVL